MADSSARLSDLKTLLEILKMAWPLIAVPLWQFGRGWWLKLKRSRRRRQERQAQAPTNRGREDEESRASVGPDRDREDEDRKERFGYWLAWAAIAYGIFGISWRAVSAANTPATVKDVFAVGQMILNVIIGYQLLGSINSFSETKAKSRDWEREQRLEDARDDAQRRVIDLQMECFKFIIDKLKRIERVVSPAGADDPWEGDGVSKGGAAIARPESGPTIGPPRADG